MVRGNEKGSDDGGGKEIIVIINSGFFFCRCRSSNTAVPVVV